MHTLSNRPIPLPTTLHILTINARRTTGREASLASLFAAVEVDVFEVEGVDVAGNVADFRQVTISPRFSED